MQFIPTSLAGAFLVETEPHADERGFFARTWCRREFAEHGLSPDLVQCSISFSQHQGTLRGMHYQRPPMAEAKLVRCVRGAIHDVIIDLRPDSPTFTQHIAMTLTAENRIALYVPEGFAHGFQTLADQTEVLYQMTQYYSPGHAAGVRWDDSAFAIVWPPATRTISARDCQWPDFHPAEWRDGR